MTRLLLAVISSTKSGVDSPGLSSNKDEK